MQDFADLDTATLRGIAARGDYTKPNGRALGRHAFAVAYAARREVDRREWWEAAHVAETGAVVEHRDLHGEPCDHKSVTEMQLCADDQAAEAEGIYRAETHAENAWLRWAEGGWDLTGAYSAELYDPRFVRA
ncbi:hypothetical protein [Actinophytocola sp.]|uniref:hypothetical protein n=1 Tax=Actinophytocola sp. TaxID=1872138 RepID=UPI002D2646CB|nr:hypothetical protein [Actinophytocola sp.]HYQ62537.1 hypothetical protein [Actinophytocola sp.]